MDSHDEVPVSILHVLEADVPEDTSIVDEDIYPAKVLDGSLNDLVAIFDRVVVGNCAASRGLDLFDDDICGLCDMVSMIVDTLSIGLYTFEDLPSPLKEPPRSLTTTFAPLEPKKVA